MRATLCNWEQYYDNYFESAMLKIIWSQRCSKFLRNNYGAHWQQYIERHPTVVGFTDMDQDKC